MQNKRKRVTHPMHHSPCQTPYTALGSLLSVALSSDMVKSSLMIPFLLKKVNVQSLRRHCSVLSDEGVQSKTARVFNSTAIFMWWEIPMLCITCVIFNVFLMIKNYEKGMFYNLIIVMSFIVLILCIWNWDLHVGIYILEHLECLRQ